MTFDMFTLITANALVGVVLSLIMELFARKQKRFKGFGWLSVSYLAIGIGHGLLAMRGNIADLLSIVVGNGLISLALFFMHSGIQIFRGIKSKYLGIHLLLCACMFSVMYFFGTEDKNLTHRIISSNIIFTLQIIICISALFRDEKGAHHISKYVVAFPLGLTVVGLLIGMIAISYSPPQEFFFKTGLVQTLPHFLSYFVMVAAALGFIWMSVNRAEDEKQILNAVLQGSLEKEQDISAKLQEQYNFLNAFLDTVPVPIFYKDAKGIYQDANHAFYEVTGLKPDEVKGKTAVDIASRHVIETTDEIDQALLETGGKQEYETQFLFEDGLRHEVIVNKAVFRDGEGEIAGIIGAVTDITERKINEAKVQHMALHDNLTGLFNRNMFFNQLGKAIAKAKRHEHALALIYIDLDGFKAVNDELGHDAGDVVLKVVGKRLMSHTREADTVCRLGGDEFAILMEMVKNRDAMATLAQKIIQTISETIPVSGGECRVGASVGIAGYPDHASDPDKLVKNADTAMYKAKKQDKGSYCFYGD